MQKGLPNAAIAWRFVQLHINAKRIAAQTGSYGQAIKFFL